MYERILKEMEIKGIRYAAELERLAGVTEGSIKSIRYGHIPTSDRLNKIANALGVSSHYLLTGEPDDDDPFASTTPEMYQRQRLALSLLEGLSDENYNAAIDYLMYLKHKEEGKINER